MKVKLLQKQPESGLFRERWYDATGDCIFVLFETEDFQEWLGVFGCGAIVQFHTAIVFSGSDNACVVAGGKGYIIDLDSGELKYRTDCDYLVDAVAIPNRDFIIACNFTKLYAFTSTGQVWQSEDIGLDGVKLQQVTSEYLAGQVWHPDGWDDFRLYFENWEIVVSQGDDLEQQSTYVDTKAFVVRCWATSEGLPKWEDSDMAWHYWIYEYEYNVPGTKKIKTHQETIKFVASAFGRWFSKYPEGFSFPIRYNRNSPTEHIRLNNFDFG